MVEHILAVSGFGRCGSSMVMQMLYCGGMPIDLAKAPWPYCEDPRQTRSEPPATKDWVAEYVGGAMKWLEPVEFRPPSGYSYRTIWLDRHAKTQAKSTVKFNRVRGAPSIQRMINSQTYKQHMHGRKARRPVALAIWRKLGPVLVVSYERIKLDPLSAARQIAEFSGHELDVEAMAKAVRNRDTRCLSYMLEDYLRAEGPPQSSPQRIVVASQDT